MRDKCIWSYLLLLLYYLFNTVCLECIITGSSVEDDATSNRYNTHYQQQEANGKLLSMHIRTSPMPMATTPAPSGPLQIMHDVTSLSNTGSGENVPHSDQQHHRSSYNLLSEAMSQAVSNEYSSSSDATCNADEFDCENENVQDRLGMEAIASLHRQLDDDDNGNIDLSESDDVCE